MNISCSNISEIQHLTARSRVLVVSSFLSFVNLTRICCYLFSVIQVNCSHAFQNKMCFLVSDFQNKGLMNEFTFSAPTYLVLVLDLQTDKHRKSHQPISSSIQVPQNSCVCVCSCFTDIVGHIFVYTVLLGTKSFGW